MRPSAVLDAQFADVAALLAATDGFVRGADIAAILGVEPHSVAYYMRRLVAGRPDLKIEGKGGCGYRMVRDEAVAGRVVTPFAYRPVESEGGYAVRYDAVRVLEALVPDLIEPLRNMALRDGGGVDGAARRLLWLGWEVERDLAATGERA